jgi:spore germination protein PF
MPSFIGAFIIQTSEGSINTGDFNNISPKTATKVFSGQGCDNVGDVSAVFNGFNATNTLDADVLDQDQILSA